MAITATGSNPYVNTYNKTSSASNLTMQRIATGSQHPDASHGASEYATSARLSSNISATSQSIENVQNLSAMIRTAAGATGNTVDALKQIKDHLINAANGTNTSLDRQAIQQNINQLITQIDSNAYVQYNSKNLLDGSQGNLTLSGIDGYESFVLGDLRSQALGLTDEQGNVTIDVSTAEAANNSLKIVGDALNKVEGLNGDLNYILDGGISLDAALDEATTQGAQLQRLEYQQANYMTMEENQLAAQESIDGANIAEQVTRLRSEKVLEQMALFAMQMFNHNSSNVLQLLR